MNDIILVEDRAEDAELCIRALSDHRLVNNVQWFSNGIEFLEHIETLTQKTIPKLILLDLKMPKMSGIEVLKKIRSHPLIKNVPVIMLTTSKAEEDIVSAYDQGVNSYVSKPLDFKEFQEKVTQVGMYWLLVNDSPH